MNYSQEQRSYDDRLEYQFLQDQVRRLTAVVREYQRRYVPIEERTVEDAPLAPWMTDPSVLSPLLVEYDNNIKSLKEQVKSYKEEFENLQGKSKTIVEENNRLHRELRTTIENQLEVLQQSDGINNKTQVQIDQLQQKMKRISDEKERIAANFEECNRELQNTKLQLKARLQEGVGVNSEITRLKEDVNSARRFAEELQKTNKQTKAELDQYIRTSKAQDAEVDNLRTENRRIQAELKTSKTLNGELQSHNNKMQDQMRYLDKDNLSNTITEKSAEGAIRKLQNEIVELDSRVMSHSKEMSKLRCEKNELEEQVTSLQKKNSILEDNEHQAVLRVRDSVQMVENALLEREQAVVREQQKSQEVLRLQEAITNLMKQADEQRKKEVANVKSQMNKQLQQLLADIQDFELEAAEKQVLYEKLQREKGAIEKELEKMYIVGPEEVTKSGQVFDELHRRIASIELSRDEHILKVEQMEAAMRRNQSKFDNESTVYLSQIAEYKKQVKNLKNDMEQISESRLTLLDEVNGLRKELLNKCEDNATLDITCASQVSSIQQKLDLKEKEYENRLRACEESHRESLNDLREMLADQQKTHSKYREETRTINQNQENTITQLRQESKHMKRRNNDLKNAYNEVQHKYEQMEKEYLGCHTSLEKMQDLYSDSEERADTANTQVYSLMNREKQLIQDRKSLNRKVDELKLDLSKSTSRGKYTSN
ncbi:sodium channel and clathrin linker 1-like isoform X2 [Clytia hemisphaerica]|uniref:Uncharacterized protein n=1 Tax=Clytia hemisphaerica TaxID=252671 RepID=A0A7M5WQ33_9CNID